MASQPLLAAHSILPPNPSFAGHGTFAVRSGWLKKGLDAIAQDSPGAEGSVFSRPEALSLLGVGKNMVGAIRFWLLATRMVREENRGRSLSATDLGHKLFGDSGWDPFLEDDATLWLLHWQLAGPRSTCFTWAYAFNCWRDWEFSRPVLADAVLGATHSLAKPPGLETVDRDVGCLLQTYSLDERSALNEDALDCPLRSLGLLRPSGQGRFRFLIGAKPSLSPALFLFAVSSFWAWKHAEARTLPVWELCYAEGSPGLVFKLDENSVLQYLDSLEEETDGQIRFEDTAQSRQVVLREDVRGLKPLDFLQRYYEGAEHAQ